MGIAQNDVLAGYLRMVDPDTFVADDFGYVDIDGLVARAVTDLLFSDGFESGDTSAWSSTNP